MNKREIMLLVRLTKKEYEILMTDAENDTDSKNKKGNTDLSKYVRKILFAEKKGHNLGKELRELNYQIRKIGVNVNQAVKRLNAGRELPGDDTYLLTALADVEEQLQIFLKIMEDS